jgi:hypothetical protein
MSFLVADDDPLVVAETLAFIDSFATEGQMTGSIARSGGVGLDEEASATRPGDKAGGKCEQPDKTQRGQARQQTTA